MRKIKVAFVGCNLYSHALQAFGAVSGAPDVFDLVGYHLPEAERETAKKRIPAIFSYREMTFEEILADPAIEAVIVETEELLLTEYARAAIEHGKHVYMEKPGGIDPIAFEGLINAVKASDKTLLIGYMYRYNPVLRDLLKRARAGELGEILGVEADMSCHHPREVREFLTRYPGGMMFYLGCHLVDLVLQLQGEPEEILPLNTKTGLDGVDSEDFGMAVFRYKSGVSTVKTTAVEYGGYARRRLLVTGSKRTVEVHPMERAAAGGLMFTGVREYSEHKWSNNGEYRESEPFDRYAPMLLDFAAMVRGEKQNEYTPDYELKLYRLLMKACGVE